MLLHNVRFFSDLLELETGTKRNGDANNVKMTQTLSLSCVKRNMLFQAKANCKNGLTRSKSVDAMITAVVFLVPDLVLNAHIMFSSIQGGG